MGKRKLWPAQHDHASAGRYHEGIVGHGLKSSFEFLGNADIVRLRIFFNLVVVSEGRPKRQSLRWLGRDPVFGSSVMLTAITDSMGFFIFLGLAAAFLI
ncbi:MAG: hypothetical protein ACREU9_11855 [Gammaproteobacteria bacterium]